MFTSLKSKIAIPIIGVLVVMVVIIVVFVSVVTSSLADSLVQERLDMSFRVVAERLDDVMARTEIVSASVASDYLVTNALLNWNEGIDRMEQRARLLEHLTVVARDLKVDSFVLRDADGAIVLRVHEPNMFSENEMDNSLASQAAFRGEATTSYTTTSTLPMGQNATSPIFYDGEIIGNITTLFFLHKEDFVDSFGELFNADVSVFNGTTRAMTTHTENGRRSIGTEVTDEEIIETVINNGKPLMTLLDVFGERSNALYYPLKNLAGTTIGMFAVMFPTENTDNAITAQRYGLIFIAVVSLAVTGALMISLINNSLKPLGNITQNIKDIADGNVNVNIDRSQISNDEIGTLTLGIISMTDSIKNMILDLEGLINEIHVNGDIDFRMDTSKYGGSFKELNDSVNTFADTYVNEVKMILGVLDEIGAGKFNIHLPALPGKKISINNTVESVISNIHGISGEIENLATQAAAGDMNVKANDLKYSGGWAKLLRELNNLVGSIAEKAYWYESILDAVPLPLSITDKNMNWIFINKSTEKYLGKKRNEIIGQPCSNWGAPICNTENCGVKCLRRGITQTQFSIGETSFEVEVTSLKDSHGQEIGYVEVIQDVTKFKTMIDKINGIMENIKTVSNQVSSGAGQISASSSSLAEGAVKQASLVEELNTSIDTISQQTQLTAENAVNANELSNKSIQNAIAGNEEMSTMLESMERIKGSSANIAKIIKTIEDIAFQTNLLALNAAVEAARAGEHGKGFAVVAEEVRTLAGRSQVAAKETNELISDTINKVDEGTEIAEKTATTLSTIVNDFESVSKIVNKIASASSEQADSISQVGESISQIEEIAQSNSALSQQTSAASQELASQSETLISLFTAD